MTHSSSDLTERDRARIRTAVAFLKDRLEEPEAVAWALGLKPDRRVERTAIVELVTGPEGSGLAEPYAAAWRLVVESWSYRSTGQSAVSALHHIRARVRAGDRSGTLIEGVADLVAPRLELESPHVRPSLPARKRRRPKTLTDLLSAGLTSVSLVYDVRGHRIDIGLDECADIPFLHALANALTARVDRGLHIAHRIYGDDAGALSAMAWPLRVYFVPPQIGLHDWDGPGGRVFEPDGVTRGMGPAVKFLYSVLKRIAELDPNAARPFLPRWRHSDEPIYRRLWAAAARSAKVVPAADVAAFLLDLHDSDFWNPSFLPEFAELRALRFCSLELDAQAMIAKRLRRGPPRRIFPRKLEAAEFRKIKRALAAIELRRIELGGAVLPRRHRDWLREAADEFSGLQTMAIDGGFRDPWVRPDLRQYTATKSEFDALEGKTRLQALEDALSQKTSASQATDWLRESAHSVLVVRDFEAAASIASRFPRVWEQFGHFHLQPAPQTGTEPPRDTQSEADRVLALMTRLSDATLEAAIESLCNWLHRWCEHVVGCATLPQLWLRAWPHAVKVTNAGATAEDIDFSTTTIRPDRDDRVPDKINTLHPPAGKLVRVFLQLPPFTVGSTVPLDDGSLFAQMRGCAIKAPGHSGLIARCLLTEKLPVFLQADSAWARRHLVEPLSMDDDHSIPLWHAVASSWLDTDVLKIIGDAVCRRVLDERINEQSRENLLSCLVHEGLSSFQQHREPAVAYARIAQTLRSADDATRAWAALEITQFQDFAYKDGHGSRALADLFRATVKPFLEQVWPQERSLATSRVSRHLACLPAVSGDAFTDAVDTIERFLTPFGCRSMLEYGYCEGDMAETLRMPRLSDAVDDTPKAHALLRLLDLTIGHTRDAMIPEDLAIALDRIESEARGLTSDPAFRRLAAAARR